MHPILFRIPLPGFLGGGALPVYAYGVMLGLSLVVGWYLTLGLAEKDGLDRETFANCYVVTAISALIAARLLYVVTNLDEFTGFAQVFEVRSGGMVAYGGFLGGFAGSWAYLRWKGMPLIPWADVAVPSLASGLMITRVGCYLYGCDFGRPLSETAPAVLKKLGTFPKWTDMDQAVGSPAWEQHVNDGRIDIGAATSLPVHPTQIYESAVGLGLLVFLLWARKHQKFRGQIFLYFAFFYGAARFALEFLRDDRERGDIPPALAPYILFPICLALFGAAYSYGIAGIVKQRSLRIATQVAAFIPAVYAMVAFRPEAFQVVSWVKLSTSQFIGLTSGIAAAIGFAILHRNALQNPVAAMALPKLPEPQTEAEADEEPKPDPKKADKKPEKKKESAAAAASTSTTKAKRRRAEGPAKKPKTKAREEKDEEPAVDRDREET